MAKKEVSREVAAPVKTDVVVAAGPVLDDAGGGFDGVTSNMLAIPFLKVLQKGSPQVDETQGEYIEAARAGMLFDNVTNKLYPGSTGLKIVPCAFRNVFLHWGPRTGEGAGFKGELAVEVAEALKARGDIKEVEGRWYYPREDGTVNPERCDRLTEAYNLYVLVLDDDGGYTPALLSLVSTQIKKARQLLSALKFVKVRAPDSSMVTPAPYANIVKVITVPESNDKGSWYGVKMELAGFCTRELFEAGREFKNSVLSGKVGAKYEEDSATPTDGKF